MRRLRTFLRVWASLLSGKKLLLLAIALSLFLASTVLAEPDASVLASGGKGAPSPDPDPF